MLPSIPHSRPTLPGVADWKSVTDLLAEGWAADGPCVGRFARAAAGWLGVSDGVAVNSGTNALHLALVAVGVQPGADVLVPAYCCAAVLNAVRLAGATPVLVDCEPGGVNLCPHDARRRVTPRTAAIVVAHLFGLPAPIEAVLTLGLPVIEDCAQSLGAMRGSQRCGSAGALAIASFYATKVITTGQGGLVAGSDAERLSSVRDLLDYDARDDWRPRFNHRMGELPAALGLWQLERLPHFLARRQALAERYDAALGQQSFPSGAVAYRYLLRVPDAEPVLGALKARGIEAKRPVYRPLHHFLGGHYPNADAAHQQIVSLPLYPSLTDAEAERVAETARQVAGLGARRFQGGHRVAGGKGVARLTARTESSAPGRAE